MAAATSSTDVGRDVEHVESLLQKLEVLKSKLCSQQKTVKALQEKANSLIDGGHTHSDQIKELLMDLEDAWLQCDYSVETRCKVLEQAKLIHSFKKSADETISWIYEKDVALSSENFGQDLQSIEILLRHHETLEGDLKAIEEQVEALHEEATMLSGQFPDSADIFEEKYMDVTNVYEKCLEKAAKRKEKLLQAEELQSYFDEARDFQAWIREMSAMITQIDLPQDIAASQAVLENHDGYKSEIDSQLQSFKKFEVRGQEIIKSGHFMTKDIQERLQNLNSSFENLLKLWQEKKWTYERNLDLQLFKKKINELEKWLKTNEYYLASEEGRSVEEVDYMIRKHEQLEQKLRLYESKFQELMDANKLEEEIKQKILGEERKRDEEIKLEEQRKLEELKRKEEEKLLEERRKERALTELSRGEMSDDDDMDIRDDLPPGEQIFKRYDSRRSFLNKNQHQISPIRPQTPVINRRLTVSTSSIIPPTAAEGFLHRKEEFVVGGKKSKSRGWKTYYTVLCGQLLCFFKDKKSFTMNFAAKPPINILEARCTVPQDYRKKKFVFRLEPTDGSSFLFEAPTDIKRDDWLNKIRYTAALPPSKQLMMPSDVTEFLPRKDSTASSNSGYYRSLDRDFDLPPDDKRRIRMSFTNDSIYDDITHSMDAVSNPIYDVPHETVKRSDTLPSYDGTMASTRSSRSSLSDESYRTALAASSMSTLHDAQEGEESSDEDKVYSMPEYLGRTKSEISLDPSEHEKVVKQMSLPRDVGSKTKKDSVKKRWSVFSLRRKQ